MPIENFFYESILDVLGNGVHVPGHDAFVSGFRTIVSPETCHSL